MNTFNLKLVGAFLVLLASAFAAHSALANPDIDYARRCSECHGPKPGPESGAIPIDLNNFANTAELADFINDYMPFGSAASCVGSCAEDFAKLLEVIVARPDFAPEANIDYSATITWPLTTGQVPYVLNLDGSGSEDNVIVTSYEWDFGDMTAGSGASVTHTFTTPGLYDVTLTVTDDEGFQDTQTIKFTAYAPGDPLVLDLRNSSELTGEVPLHSKLSALGSRCIDGPCTVEWDFGDSSPNVIANSAATVLHDYTAPGEYTVVATITDDNGVSETDTLTIDAEGSESFYSYVQSCKSALDFDDEDVPATMNCAAGDLFAKTGPINDYVGYEAITDKVDLVFACRWLSDASGDTEPPFVKAASIEMIMHNRENGNTCFFRAHEEDEFAPSTLVSPTVAANAAPGTPESKYWVPPIDLTRELPCADCHVAGPYIATPRIAPFLAKYGLLNNGHDTFGLVRDETNPDVIHGNYNIVGDTFQILREMAVDFNVSSELTCSNGCHSIGYRSNQGDIDEAGTTFNLLPGILSVIFHSADTVIAAASIHDQGVMPANNPEVGSADNSHYTWINADTPLSGPNDSDTELFSEAKVQFETLLEYCGDPGYIRARAVGSNSIFELPQFADTLETFNAKEGVVCRNSSQGDGGCNDFRVRYQCTASSGAVTTTDWYNTDSPSFSGDFETRSDHDNASVGGTVCYGAEVTGIEASSVISTGWTAATPGPVDRLAKFDRYGLVCNNTDQVDGQCSNYVVKFFGCGDAPEPYNAKIQSAWSGRILTAAGSGNDADVRVQPQTASWNTQDWVVEPVADTDYVRLRNTSTGRYLNAQNNSNYADVVLYDYVADWGSQQWIIESAGGSNVRFKNVWSGYYLTATNNGNYADLKAQPLNTGWPSQRWTVVP